MTVFPFTPNWREPVREQLGYMTEILSSRAGREQRRANRISPRRAFHFLLTLSDARFVAYKNFRAAHRTEELTLPDPVRNVLLTSSLDAGNTTFTVAGTRSWLLAGAPVCLSENGRAELRTVFSVVGSTVTLTQPVAGAWARGVSLRPALVGRLGAELSGALHTTTVHEPQIVFNITPTSEAEEVIPPAPTTVLGRELLVQKPNWAKAPDLVVLQPTEQLDYGFGQVTTGFPIEFETKTLTATYLGKTYAEAKLLKDVFMRARGSQGELYVPSWEPDMVASGTTAAGDPTLTLAGTDLALAFGESTTEKALAFRWLDGVTAYRKISALAVVGGNSVATMTAALDRAVDDSVMISWLRASRFASDDMELSWYTNQVADVSWAIRTLEDLPV